MRVAVPRVKLIKDLDQMRNQAFSPPFALMEFIQNAEARGEAWQAILAYGSISGGARWVAVFPGSAESLFFTEGDQLRGRWDPEHEIFFPEDGPPLNLLGNPVTLSSVEEAAEEEEGWGGPGFA